MTYDELSAILDISEDIVFGANKMNRWWLISIFFLSATMTIVLFLLSEYINRRLLSSYKYNLNPHVLINEERLYPASENQYVHDLIIQRSSVPSVRRKTNEKALENEAVSSTHAALEMDKEGKIDKAHKLFLHAISLAPKHPDILNYYGEFLEKNEKDIMAADLLYAQALQQSPTHHRALSNRLRTSLVVEELDNRMFGTIEKKRDLLSAIPETSRALIRVKKEAYFQHIYHTVGIEGNTMSLSQTRSIVETQMAVAGKSIMEHNEILGLDAAMKYINATLVKRFGPITLKDITEIHRRVLGYVDPFHSGAFRQTEVYVGGHRPPPPQEIQEKMQDFERWLNSEDAVRMHPIQYAALAHYKLVHIHPFDDGNGRTSRLLMNAILMQAGYPPVIILKQDRHKYYEALESANEGDVRPFIRFIADCTEKTLDLFLWATQEYTAQIPAIDDESQKSQVVTNLKNDDYQRIYSENDRIPQ